MNLYERKNRTINFMIENDERLAKYYGEVTNCMPDDMIYRWLNGTEYKANVNDDIYEITNNEINVYFSNESIITLSICVKDNEKLINLPFSCKENCNFGDKKKIGDYISIEYVNENGDNKNYLCYIIKCKDGYYLVSEEKYKKAEQSIIKFDKRKVDLCETKTINKDYIIDEKRMKKIYIAVLNSNIKKGK